MAYTKTSWVARVGTALNRFLKANESSASVELTADPTGVSTAGTPFTADNMNKIEQGIYDAHEAMGGNFAELDTDGEPTFAKLTLTTSTYDTKVIAADSYWVVPQGVYTISPAYSSAIKVWTGSAWAGLGAGDVSGTIISDGSNVRIVNASPSATQTIYYRKFS